MICPKCSVPTQPFNLEADLYFDKCNTCEGMWMDKGELARTTAGISDWIDAQKAKTGPASKYKCPKCLGTTMHEVAYVPGKKLIVETCRTCEGLWLDARELPQIQEALRKHRIQMKKKKASGM